jgi:hypothetical protein
MLTTAKSVSTAAQTSTTGIAVKRKIFRIVQKHGGIFPTTVPPKGSHNGFRTTFHTHFGLCQLFRIFGGISIKPVRTLHGMGQSSTRLVDTGN